MNKSWKTGISGWASGIYIIIGEVCDFFAAAPPYTTDGVFSVETLMVGVGLLGLGAFIREKTEAKAK